MRALAPRAQENLLHSQHRRAEYGMRLKRSNDVCVRYIWSV